MFQIIACMKLRDSYNRIINAINVNGIEWEEYLSDLENLQEKIVYSEYDLAIIDEKIWWRDEAINLLEQKGVEIIEFNGNFEEVIKLLTDKIPNEIEEDFNIEDVELDNFNSTSPLENSKIIIQEKVIVQEKVIYKSKNIKQNIMSVMSTENATVRDNTACNIGAVLCEDSNVKTLLVDITNFNNIIHHVEIESINTEEPFGENFNGNTIKNCVNKVNKLKNLDILKINNKGITKKNIKSILFAARDYDNIIFVVENDISNLTVSFVLNLSHNVFIVTEPLFLSAKNNIQIINDLIKKGQVNENIKILLTEIDPLDKDTICYMYKDFLVYFLDRDIQLELINDKKLISDKKEKSVYYQIMGINKKSNSLLKNILKK